MTSSMRNSRSLFNFNYIYNQVKYDITFVFIYNLTNIGLIRQIKIICRT